MTMPIARLVATRFADAEPPLRFCYLASAYRAVRPQRGQMREFVQAGVELIGAPAPEGTAEVIEVLGAALDAAGLEPRRDRARRRRPLPRTLLGELGVDGEARDADPGAPRGPRPGRPRGRARRARGSAASDRDLLALSQLRGGPEVLERARELGGAAVERATDAPRRRPTRPSGRARRRRPGPDSTSACCATSATTAARSSRSTTRRSATSSAAAAATTGC